MKKVSYDTNSVFLDRTGNVFVDCAQLTLQILLNKKEAEELTVNDIIELKNSEEISGVKWINENYKRFKSYSMLFGMNNMRSQVGFKTEENRKRIFQGYLHSLIDAIVIEFHPDKQEELNQTCSLCSRVFKYDFNHNLISILETSYINFKEKDKDKKRFSCREYFPLAGSMGSESQNFNNMSEPPDICPRCLFVVYYLFFSVFLVEGNLAIFQASNNELQYRMTRNAVQEYQTKIENTPKGSNFEILGKASNNKNKMIFDMITRYSEHDLPQSPSRKDIVDHYPSKLIYAWLWKFSNSGTGPFLSYEKVPNSTFSFLYLIDSFEYLPYLEKILSVEYKIIKYTPNQLYNCLKNQKLYQFEKIPFLETENINGLTLLYYFFILGINKNQMKVYVEIANKVNVEENVRNDNSYKRKNTIEKTRLIMQKTLELVENRSLSFEEFYISFSVNPKSEKWRKAIKIILQLIELNASTDDFTSMDNKLHNTLSKEDLLEYEILTQDINYTEEEKFILYNVSEFLIYYSKRFNQLDVPRKIKENLSRSSFSSFFFTYVSMSRKSCKTLDYIDFRYLVETIGHFYNLRLIIQIVFHATINNEITSDFFHHYKIPEIFRNRVQNKNLETHLLKYLQLRIEEKGYVYVKRNFADPLCHNRIRINQLRYLLEERKDDLGFNDFFWYKLLINIETNNQENNYFYRYAILFVSSFFNKSKNEESQGILEGTKTLDVIK